MEKFNSNLGKNSLYVVGVLVGNLLRRYSAQVLIQWGNSWRAQFLRGKIRRRWRIQTFSLETKGNCLRTTFLMVIINGWGKSKDGICFCQTWNARILFCIFRQLLFLGRWIGTWRNIKIGYFLGILEQPQHSLLILASMWLVYWPAHWRRNTLFEKHPEFQVPS